MDYYKILGISKNATEEDIKKAYRKLAMKHHPDRNKGDKSSEEEFKKIGEAYAILSDSSKRKEYDMRQAYGGKSHFSGGGSFNHEDIHDFMNQMFRGGHSPFDDIFGQSFGRQRQQRRIYSIRLSFWEAVFGVNKSIEILDENGVRQQIVIPFPAGIDDDITVGMETPDGKQFYFHVDIEPDPQFTRNHLDLHVEVDIPMSKAILGGELIFPHWEHNYEVKIPPGTQQGQVLRISNGGIKKDMFVGDLYLKCNIKIPTKLTKKQKEILEQYAKTEKENTSFFDTLKSSWSKFFTKKN